MEVCAARLRRNRGRGSGNHLGVEVADADAVDAEQQRLAEAGLASIDERGSTCCYARQDKFWVEGTPDGERWEVYTVLEDSQSFWGQDGGQGWAAVEASLDASAAAASASAPDVHCCGTQEGTGQSASAGSCCS